MPAQLSEQNVLRMRIRWNCHFFLGLLIFSYTAIHPLSVTIQ